MAHPKRKISKQRRNKRRTHQKLTPATLGICQTTGEVHRLHHAHMFEGKLMYKGQVIYDTEEL